MKTDTMKRMMAAVVLLAGYEGIFARLGRAHPVDYYMALTREGDYWQGGPFDRKRFKLRVAEWKAILATWDRMKPPFCAAVGQRVSDVILQGEKRSERPDVFARAGDALTACDVPCAGVPVDAGWLVLDLAAQTKLLPFLNASEVKDGEKVVRRVRCGGPDYKDWHTDQIKRTPTVLFAENPNVFEPRALPLEDHYAGWAETNFGNGAIGAVFARMDGRTPLFTFDNMGAPVNPRPWVDVEREFAFVEELERFRVSVTGIGARERLGIWLSYFKSARSAAQAGCLLGELSAKMKEATAVTELAAQRQFLREQALPVLANMTRTVGEACGFFLDSIVDIGGIQSVIDLEARNGLLGYALKHLARGVYKVEPPASSADFEYHIEAKTAGGKTLLWPVTAPDRNQTVVVWNGKSW